MAQPAPGSTGAPYGRVFLTWFLLPFLVVVATVGGNFAGLTGLLAYVGLVAIIGLGVGLLTGSPQMNPSRRGAIGFAVGFAGTVCAAVISLLIILAFETERVEVIPVLVALFAGVLGLVAGAACAIGALVGGFLRGRIARKVVLT